MKKPQQPFRLILADDDPDDCEMFNEALKRVATDATLETVHNGKELLEYLHNTATELPHLVILDLNMPIMGGMEAVEAIRNSKQLRHLSVVILSTSSRQEDIEQTCRKGADGYISKPSSFGRLQEIIQKILNIHWKPHTHNSTQISIYNTF